MIQQAQVNGDLSVEALCEALDVAPSGYDARCAREVRPRQQADARLGDAIERVFVESRRTYGSQQVWQGLRERGIRSSRKRVSRATGKLEAMADRPFDSRKQARRALFDDIKACSTTGIDYTRPVSRAV